MSKSIIETLLSKICFVKQHCQIGQDVKIYVPTLQEAAAVALGLLDEYINKELVGLMHNCMGSIDGVYLIKGGSNV